MKNKTLNKKARRGKQQPLKTFCFLEKFHVLGSSNETSTRVPLKVFILSSEHLLRCGAQKYKFLVCKVEALHHEPQNFNKNKKRQETHKVS